MNQLMTYTERRIMSAKLKTFEICNIMSGIFTSLTMNSTVLFILSSTFSLHKLSIALMENMPPITSVNLREKRSQQLNIASHSGSHTVIEHSIM